MHLAAGSGVHQVVKSNVISLLWTSTHFHIILCARISAPCLNIHVNNDLFQAIEEDADDAVQWHQLGLHSLCTTQFKTSLKFLKAAVARSRDCSVAWSNLGIYFLSSYLLPFSTGMRIVCCKTVRISFFNYLTFLKVNILIKERIFMIILN